MNAAARPPRHRPGGRKLVPEVERPIVGDGPPATSTQTADVRESVSSSRQRAGSDGLPRYQQTARVEGRLWPDQVTALADLRRKVSQARNHKPERITDNTLLRIAVDLLLAHAGDLRGDTEDQLRQSVLPEDPESGSL